MALDDRALNESLNAKSEVYLVPFAQEKGRLCRYVPWEQESLPYMYIGKKLYDQLDTALKKDGSYCHSFIKNGNIDPKCKYNAKDKLVLYDKSGKNLQKNVVKKDKHHS